MNKKSQIITLICTTVILTFLISNHLCRTKTLERKAPPLPKYVSFKIKHIVKNLTPPTEYKDKHGNVKEMPAPNDTKAWQNAAREKEENLPPELIEGIKKDFKITTKEVFIRGVKVLEITPKNFKNKESALIYAHPGGFYSLSPEILLGETAAMATKSKTRVYSIDYRLLPKPEINLTMKDQAMDVEKVYKGIVEDFGYKPENIGIWGCSAGSTLSMMAINKMSKESYPLPAAYAPNAGLYDMTLESDSMKIMVGIDPMVHPELYVIPIIKMTKVNTKDPEISVVLDNFKGRNWPPTMLIAGLRETLLSDSIRMNTKLKLAGHDSQLYVQDAMPHCWASFQSTKEAKQFYQILDDFFREKGVYN